MPTRSSRKYGSREESLKKLQSSYRGTKKSKEKSGPLIVSGLGNVRKGSSSHNAGLAQLAKARSAMESSRPRGLAKAKQSISNAKAKVVSKINAGKSAVRTRLKSIGAKVKATQASASTKLKSIGRKMPPALPPVRMPLASVARYPFRSGIAKAGMASAARLPMPKR